MAARQVTRPDPDAGARLYLLVVDLGNTRGYGRDRVALRTVQLMVMWPDGATEEVMADCDIAFDRAIQVANIAILSGLPVYSWRPADQPAPILFPKSKGVELG